jgi:hypothetical protein
MTMKFRDVKASLVTLLGDAAAGRYQVVGYEPLPRAARDYEGDKRTVRVFYNKGQFPKGGGSITSPVNHNVSITLELICTSASEVDLGTLEDPESTDAQRAAALVGSTPAALLADESWDEFADILWNVIMAPQNQWLGFGGDTDEKYKVSNRWIDDAEKDRLIPDGEYCILTGFMTLGFTVKEQSDQGLPATAHGPSTTDFTPIDGDTVQKTVQETE